MIQAKYVRDRQTPKGRPIGYADDTGQVKSAATLYRAGVTSVETSTRCARIAASSGAYSQRAGKSLQGFAICEMGCSGRFAQQQFLETDVRFGSKADIATGQLNVCFTPKSGHWNQRRGREAFDALIVVE